MSQFQGPSQSQATRIPRRGQRTRGTDFGQTIMPAPPRAGNPAVAVPQGSELKQITGILEGAAKLGTQIGKQKQAEERQVRLTERMDRAEGTAAARVDLASHGEAIRADPMKYRLDAEGNMNPFGTEVDLLVRDALASIPENESPAFMEGYANNLRVSISKFVLGHRDAEGARTNETLLAQTAQVLAAGEANPEEVRENLRTGWYGTLTDQQWSRIEAGVLRRAAEIHVRNAIKDGAYPRVQNDDGTWSSVKLGTMSEGGFTYVIPFMWGGVQHHRETAVKNARDVGLEFFPRFKEADHTDGQPTDGPIGAVRERESADEQAQQWIEEKHSVAHEILPPNADWDYGKAGAKAFLDEALERGAFALKSVEKAEGEIEGMQDTARTEDEERLETGMPWSALDRARIAEEDREAQEIIDNIVEENYKDRLSQLEQELSAWIVEHYLTGQSREEVLKKVKELAVRFGIEEDDYLPKVEEARRTLESRHNEQKKAERNAAVENAGLQAVAQLAGEQRAGNGSFALNLLGQVGTIFIPVEEETDPEDPTGVLALTALQPITDARPPLAEAGGPPITGKVEMRAVPVTLQEAGITDSENNLTPKGSAAIIDNHHKVAFGASNEEILGRNASLGIPPSAMPEDPAHQDQWFRAARHNLYFRDLKQHHTEHGRIDQVLARELAPLSGFLANADEGAIINKERLPAMRVLWDKAMVMRQHGLLEAYTDTRTAETVRGLASLIHVFGARGQNPDEAFESAIGTLTGYGRRRGHIDKKGREGLTDLATAALEKLNAHDGPTNTEPYIEALRHSMAFLDLPETDDLVTKLAGELFESQYAILDNGTTMHKGLDSWLTGGHVSIAMVAMQAVDPSIDDEDRLTVEYNERERRIVLLVNGQASANSIAADDVRELFRLSQIKIRNTEIRRSFKPVNKERIKEHRKEYFRALRESGIYQEATLAAFVEVPSYDQWAKDNPPDLVDADKYLGEDVWEASIKNRPHLKQHILAIQENAPVSPPAMTAKRIVMGTGRAIGGAWDTTAGFLRASIRNAQWWSEKMIGTSAWPGRMATSAAGVSPDTSEVGFLPNVWTFFGGKGDLWGRDWVEGQKREKSIEALERLQRGAGGAR